MQEIVQWGTVNEFLDPDGLDSPDGLLSEAPSVSNSIETEESGNRVQKWLRNTAVGISVLFGAADMAHAERNVARAGQETRENIDAIDGQPFEIAEDGIVASLHMDWEGKPGYFVVERKDNVTKFTAPGMYYDSVNNRYIHIFMAKKSPRGASVKKMREVFMGEQFKVEDEEFETRFDQRLQQNVTGAPRKYVNTIKSIEKKPDVAAQVEINPVKAPVNNPDLVTTVRPSTLKAPVTVKRAESPSYQTPVPEVQDALRAVRDAGYVTIDHGVDPRNRKESIQRQPGLFRPTGSQEIKMDLTIDNIESSASGYALIPMPINIGDQLHVASQFYIVEDGKFEPVTPQIIYDEQDGIGQGFVNAFAEIKVGSRKRAAILARHYLLQGKYNDVTPDQVLAAAGQSGSEDIRKGVMNALQIPFGSNGRDCGDKAMAGCKADPEHIFAVEGYTPRFPNFGGTHAVNAVTMNNKKGIVFFDGLDQNPIVSPDPHLVITGIATGKGFKYSLGRSNNKIGLKWTIGDGSNYGMFARVETNGNRLIASFPGVGPRGDVLAADVTPDVIKNAEKALWQEHMKIYEQPNIALGQK